MNLCDIETIRAVLGRHGFHFSKAKGQNFLTQSWVPQNIALEAGIDGTCGVLEVGPGIGPLTQQLCRHAKKVVAVEVDRTLQPILAETMADAEIRSKLIAAGLEPSYATGDAVLAQIEDELPRMRAIAQRAQIRAD